MGYFGRLRELATTSRPPAAAHTGPVAARTPPAAARTAPTEQIEQETVRLASPVEPLSNAASRQAFETRPARGSREAADPAGEARPVSAQPQTPQLSSEDETEPAPELQAVRMAAEAERVDRSPDLPALERHVVVERPSPPEGPGSAAPEPPAAARYPDRETRAGTATALAPSARPPLRPSVPESSDLERQEPDERFREALVRVRRWLAEPRAGRADEGERITGGRRELEESEIAMPSVPERPLRPEHGSSRRREAPGPDLQATPRIVEERTELSIGTIYVTVEETESDSRTTPGGRQAARPPRPEVVPRNYLRGW